MFGDAWKQAFFLATTFIAPTNKVYIVGLFAAKAVQVLECQHTQESPPMKDRQQNGASIGHALGPWSKS